MNNGRRAVMEALFSSSSSNVLKHTYKKIKENMGKRGEGEGEKVCGGVGKAKSVREREGSKGGVGVGTKW